MISQSFPKLAVTILTFEKEHSPQFFWVLTRWDRFRFWVWDVLSIQWVVEVHILSRRDCLNTHQVGQVQILSLRDCLNTHRVGQVQILSLRDCLNTHRVGQVQILSLRDCLSLSRSHNYAQSCLDAASFSSQVVHPIYKWNTIIQTESRNMKLLIYNFICKNLVKRART